MHDNINLTQRYERFSDDTLEAAVSGRIFLLTDSGRPEDAEGDVLKIAHAVYDGTADFNNIYGFFKIVIADKTSGRTIFFGDNAASQNFFYDPENGTVSDSLLRLSRMGGKKRSFNLYAAAQYLAYGCTITQDTLVQGILKTDADMYYIVEGGKVSVHDKKLLPLSERYTKGDLYDFVKLMTRGMNGEGVCARVTGGTDSRAVLAALLKAGVRPSLFISGYEDNPDVSITQEIGRVTGLEVSALNPHAKEDNWLERSFDFCDGMHDVVGAYRQLILTEMAVKKGSLWFGGVGGEFYKNSFCMPFRYHCLFRTASAREIINIIFLARMRTALGKGFLHDEVKKLAARLSDDIYSLLAGRVEREKGNLARFNTAGVKRMQGYTCMTNTIANYITQIDPLMDCHTIRSVSYMSPVALSMHVWQRKQIHKNFPALGAIRTDQGYSCSLNPLRLNAERIKKGLFWSSRVVARVKQKLGLRWKDITAKYWDNDYADARKTTYWGGGITICKQLHILDEGANSENIPMHLTGVIILFGMMGEFLEKL